MNFIGKSRTSDFLLYLVKVMVSYPKLHFLKLFCYHKNIMHTGFINPNKMGRSMLKIFAVLLVLIAVILFILTIL